MSIVKKTLTEKLASLEAAKQQAYNSANAEAHAALLKVLEENGLSVQQSKLPHSSLLTTKTFLHTNWDNLRLLFQWTAFSDEAKCGTETRNTEAYITFSFPEEHSLSEFKPERRTNLSINSLDTDYRMAGYHRELRLHVLSFVGKLASIILSNPDLESRLYSEAEALWTKRTEISNQYSADIEALQEQIRAIDKKAEADETQAFISANLVEGREFFCGHEFKFQVNRQFSASYFRIKKINDKTVVLEALHNYRSGKYNPETGNWEYKPMEGNSAEWDCEVKTVRKDDFIRTLQRAMKKLYRSNYKVGTQKTTYSSWYNITNSLETANCNLPMETEVTEEEYRAATSGRNR